MRAIIKFERFFGHREKEIIGKTDYDFVDKQLADFFRENDKAAIAAKKPTMNEEEITYADDGHKELLETIKTPMFDHSGELIGVLGVGRDITERKKMQETINRSQKMDAIGQMAGGIAHDFNNILGIIMGNANLLRRPLEDNEKAANRLGAITKSAERAVDLTKQLLSFSRKEPEDISPIDINKVVMEVDNLIARTITPEIGVSQNLAKDIWLTELDAGGLDDVLLNLVLNARDAMPNGGTLTVGTRNCSLDTTKVRPEDEFTPGDYVELAISDTGVGISAENLEHIYEPFFTTKSQGKGTGLGLSMVFGFVQRSGGHIKVESEVDAGTKFSLYFPRSGNNQEQQDEFPVDSERLPRGNEVILAVDDEEELLLLAKDSLEDLGYKVVTACDGQNALYVLNNDPSISVLFSDVVMPGGINGYQLAERAIKLRPDLKVLLTSGHIGKSLKSNQATPIAMEMLNKPYNLNQLAKQLRVLLDQPAK